MGEEILFITSSCLLYSRPGRCVLCLSCSTERLKAQTTFPASSGEFPRAPGRGGRLRTKELGNPHLSSHLHPQGAAQDRGTENCDTDAEARGSTAGWVAS